MTLFVSGDVYVTFIYLWKETPVSALCKGQRRTFKVVRTLVGLLACLCFINREKEAGGGMIYSYYDVKCKT